MIVVGAALHLLVLAAPALLAGRPPTGARALAFLALASAFYVSEMTASRPERVTGRSGLSLATGLGLLASFWAGLLGTAGPVSPLLAGAGALLVGAGIVLRRRAMRALGRWFRSDLRIDTGQPLVTGGIYARMRHPSEAGLLLIAFGAAALLASPAAFAIALLWIAPCVLRRVRAEDRLLARRFPAEFAVWARRVPPLV